VVEKQPFPGSAEAASDKTPRPILPDVMKWIVWCTVVYRLSFRSTSYESLFPRDRRYRTDFFTEQFIFWGCSLLVVLPLIVTILFGHNASNIRTLLFCMFCPWFFIYAGWAAICGSGLAGVGTLMTAFVVLWWCRQCFLQWRDRQQD
jgi:hypothetical protein